MSFKSYPLIKINKPATSFPVKIFVQCFVLKSAKEWQRQNITSRSILQVYENAITPLILYLGLTDAELVKISNIFRYDTFEAFKPQAHPHS